jgi:GNAT superfamily N-acetyltransferase
MEIKYKDFLISDDKSKLQINTICKLLNSTYWAENRLKDIIEKSIENSICFGVYHNGAQIGFARCLTDYATVYWLADVIIDDDYRKQGIGKALVDVVIHHEELKGCFGILATRDAHGLYEQYGFKLVTDKYMRKD